MGSKSNLINKFMSEKIVSGSDVLNSDHPIKNNETTNTGKI